MRRFFSKSGTSTIRHSFQPCLEGLESRWVPATHVYSNLTKTLTVTAEAADTVITFTQATNLPFGHITAGDNGGAFFNDPLAITPPSRLVKNIVVKVPAAVNTDVNFNSIVVGGNVTVTSAATAGVVVNFNAACQIGKNLKVTSTALSADDSSSTAGGLRLGGSLTASLNGAATSNIVDLFGADIGGNLLVTGKAQGDDVEVVDSSVAGTATFNLGDGANFLAAGNTGFHVAKTLTYVGTGGIDDLGLFFEVFVGGNATFKLGNGADSLNFSPGFVGGNLSVTAGVDDDTVFLTALVVQKNSTINLGNSTVGQDLILNQFDTGNLSITGGTGIDNVTLARVTARGNTTIKLLAGFDNLRIDDSGFIGTALFDGSAGNDQFLIENLDFEVGTTSFGGKLTILGGTEDDNLTLGNGNNANTRLTINGATTIYNGGLGSNSFVEDLSVYSTNGPAPVPNWL